MTVTATGGSGLERGASSLHRGTLAGCCEDARELHAGSRALRAEAMQILRR